MKFWLLLVGIISILHSLVRVSSLDHSDTEYWNELSAEQLKNAAQQKQQLKRAKNVIIFLGDGMGVSTITAARTYRRQIENIDQLLFETFPNLAMIKTYNVDYQVPDSAGTATAFMTGVKTNKGVLGVNGKVRFEESDCQLVLSNSVDSVLMHALREGKLAGVVTTTSITDATPAASYSHVSSRYYQASTPAELDAKCKDIARQLVEDKPGVDLSVILGGGSRNFLPTSSDGLRTDGRDLFKQWKSSKQSAGLSSDQYQVVTNEAELKNINYEKTRYLFGSFAPKNMQYEAHRVNKSKEPDLATMTEVAINVLSRGEHGFVLMVEGGKIDKAHHQNQAFLSLTDTLAFERAVERALNMVNLEETLIIVTADHSHGFTLNGYAKRSEDILGFTEHNDSNGNQFTALMYATGPGWRANGTKGETVAQTTEPDYRQLAAVPLDSATHGGEDVVAYAKGPMSHLMRSTQEQTYVAHLMLYAACLGPYKQQEHCQQSSPSAALSSHHKSCILAIVSVAVILVLQRSYFKFFS